MFHRKFASVRLTLFTSIAIALMAALTITAGAQQHELPPLFAQHRPAWELHFTSGNDAVMSVMPGESTKTFYDPILKKNIQWEQDVYSPACAPYNSKIYCVYRSFGKDSQWREGLAWSEDGIHFARSEKPILYARPEDTFLGGLLKLKDASISYGDTRLFEGENGTYYEFFNFFSYGKINDQQLAIAISRDMRNWKMQGRAFARQAPRDLDLLSGRKVQRLWPTIVTQLDRGRLVAARIHGKYWMYLRCSTRDPVRHQILIATSDNMLDWNFLRDSSGQPVAVLPQRRGYFDSAYIDPVAAVLRADGILLIYNGINSPTDKGGDPRRLPLSHYPAQALFDPHDPSRLLKRSKTPFEGGDRNLEKKPIVFWPAPLYEAFALTAFRNELWLYWNGNFGRRTVGVWKAVIPASMSAVDQQSSHIGKRWILGSSQQAQRGQRSDR